VFVFFYDPGLPDENINKKSHSAKKGQKKAKPIVLRPEKKPNFICGIDIPLSQKNI